MYSKNYYLLVYDISDDKNRDKLYRELLRYGMRVQYSVFELYISEKALKDLIKRITPYITSPNDTIIIYPLTKEEYKSAKKEGNKIAITINEDIFI